MNTIALYEEMLRLHRAGAGCAFAVVVETAGSAPRKAGARMLVRADGSALGTVGGGRLEAETVVAAGKAIRTGRPCTLRFELTEENGYACGGQALIFVEPVLSPPRLIMVGAGHVGVATARAAAAAGFRVTLAEVRGEGSPAAPPADGIEAVIAPLTPDLFGMLEVDPETFIVIAASTHDDDFAAAGYALATDARYIGLIGSRRKRQALERYLAGKGFAERDIDRVRTPVGLAIGAETPGEIAVSIVAELIRTRRGGEHGDCGSPAGGGTCGADGVLQAAPSPR